MRLRLYAVTGIACALAACGPDAGTPATGAAAYDLALRRCQSLALQRLPNISANIMIAPGMYSNNGIACRPGIGGAECAPRANWLPPASGDPNASNDARAVLVSVCMRGDGWPAP